MILALRDLFHSVREPLDEALAYAHYLSTEAAVRFAEMRVSAAKAELAATIAARDAAAAAIRTAEPPPRRIPDFLLRKDKPHGDG